MLSRHTRSRIAARLDDVLLASHTERAVAIVSNTTGLEKDPYGTSVVAVLHGHTSWKGCRNNIRDRWITRSKA